MIYWIFLALAILSEIIGTVSMKYASLNNEITGHVVMYIMITTSYVLLSLAIKRVALGVAYALWEGIGILLITLVSWLWFDEALTLTKCLGLVALFIGVVLLKSGTRKTPAEGADKAIKSPGCKRSKDHAIC